MGIIDLDAMKKGNELVARIFILREQEKETAQKRHELEDELSTLLGHPAEGSQTHELNGCKVTLTGKVSRTITDDKAMLAAYPELVKTKHVLDTGMLRGLRRLEPIKYQDACQYLLVKPAKTGVTIKPVEVEELVEVAA